MATKARKRERHRGQVRRARGWVVYAAGAAVAAIAVTVLIAVGALSRGGDDGGAGGPVIVPSPGVPGLVSDGRVLGQPGAPVSIVEYADFQ